MEVRLYQYGNYKDYVNDWVISHPKSGRGKYLELSKVLNVHTTLISQIFKGDRDLSLEQAYSLCDYLGFNSLEIEYFLNLVQKQRSGNHKLKQYFEDKILNLQNELQDMKSRIKERKELDENDKAIFYSNWFYSAIRIACSLDSVKTKEDVVEYTGLPLSLVSRVLEFLISVQLVIEKEGELTGGPAITHLDRKSPLVARHHSNWRIKAMDRHPMLSEEEFCFSAPLSINSKDVPQVREILTGAIEEISEIVKNSDDVDELYCVNIDWFNPIKG